jgi:hypothetical protein
MKQELIVCSSFEIVCVTESGSMKQAEHIEEMRNMHINLVWNFKGKRSLGIPRCRRKNKMLSHCPDDGGRKHL